MTSGAITTTRKKHHADVERANVVAKATGSLYVPRDRSIASMEAEFGVVYVVSPERESLHFDGKVAWVHPDLFNYKAKAGRSHPLLRALEPEGGQKVEHVVDGTLGLGRDSLHIAWGLGCSLTGLEASPWLTQLCIGGFARMANEVNRKWALGAARVSCVNTTLECWLEQVDSLEVLYIDPMFDEPAGASPNFDAVRVWGRHERLSVSTLDQAVHKCVRRVVMKVPGATPLERVAAPSGGWNGRLRGGAVDYLIYEKEVEPVWEEPDRGDIWEAKKRKRRLER